MKVVLRSDVVNVGKKGDIAEVADGYGRNFLIPRGLAFVASDGVIDQAKAMRRARDLRDAKDRAGAEEIARSLVAQVVTIKAKAHDGKLFGSISVNDVVAAVAAQTHVELDRKQVHLTDPIKTVGSHQVPVKLHSDVQFAVTLEVVAG